MHNVIGNHGVLRRAASDASDSSLMASRESEVYEREADPTAEQMARTPAQSVQRKPT
ncbi:MAG: hypothetical protein ACOC5K_00575 [Chloroflexota bacterium]